MPLPPPGAEYGSTLVPGLLRESWPSRAISRADAAGSLVSTTIPPFRSAMLVPRTNTAKSPIQPSRSRSRSSPVAERNWLSITSRPPTDAPNASM